MPSILLNHTIHNLAAGVSQQFTESRFETQVEEMVNCMPSIARGALRRNPVVSVSSGLTDMISTTDYFSYSYDRGTGEEQYLVIIGSASDWYVYNINTGTQINKGTNAYLSIPVGTKPREMFKLITIGDTTFVLNKSKTPIMDSTVANPNGVANSHKNKAFYWVKKTASTVTATKSSGTDPVTSGSILEGYKYTLDGTTVQGYKDTRPGETAVDLLDGVNIATELASQLGVNYLSSESFVYNTSVTSASTWIWSDSFGNEASLGVHGAIDSAAKLPARLPTAIGDVVVKVEGSLGDEEIDDYWLKYDSSEELWLETVEPGIDVQLKYSTMPHCLYRLSNGSFVFDTFQEVAADGLSLTGVSSWGDRVVGSEVTSPDPSFIGKQITSMFFHKNRLGFITGDSVILSATNDYGNFFPTTVQVVPDSDHIDLAVATTNVTVLRHAVSTAGTLVLFSDDAQFTLGAIDGVLTPSSANISTASSYTYSDAAEAKAIGDGVYFMSSSGGYAQLFKFHLTEGLRTTKAIPLTAHIPSFFPYNMVSITGHSVLGYNFFTTPTAPNTVYVLTHTSTGEKDIQNAFHTWTFETAVTSVHVINNSVYFLFADGSLGYITLELPGDITSTTYLDSALTEYTSKITLSKYHVKDENGNGTSRGRLQLRTLKYTISPISKYKTTIYNTGLVDQEANHTNWILTSGYWNDALEWVDDAVWKDAVPYYNRVYYNDKQVTVSGNSDTTVIEFSNDELNPSKGFELSTINIEAFFHQRSKRY